MDFRLMLHFGLGYVMSMNTLHVLSLNLWRQMRLRLRIAVSDHFGQIRRDRVLYDHGRTGAMDWSRCHVHLYAFFLSPCYGVDSNSSHIFLVFLSLIALLNSMIYSFRIHQERTPLYPSTSFWLHSESTLDYVPLSIILRHVVLIPNFILAFRCRLNPKHQPNRSYIPPWHVWLQGLNRRIHIYMELGR